MELANSIDFKDIINWSITFAGFLFTSFSIIISIPDNRFINKLREKRLYRNILISYGITIMVQISISILIIFKIRDNFVLSLFITTLVESIVLIVYLLKIAYYSSRAK
ncbi:hypothetical protein [Peptostreptococcus russellii]|uniref:hypothetical protein n=1 Tax=Peptostreptococcus russellii TaxID=215200 RepID=UPI003F58D995